MDLMFESESAMREGKQKGNPCVYNERIPLDKCIKQVLIFDNQNCFTYWNPCIRKQSFSVTLRDVLCFSRRITNHPEQVIKILGHQPYFSICKLDIVLPRIISIFANGITHFFSKRENREK